MNLRHLEMRLERLEGFERPTARLEQYQTPASVAARLLHHAAMQGAIEGRRVCDLGCGTGILACGAALLGASAVTGIDVDAGAIEVARRNAEAFDLSIEFLVADIRSPDVDWAGLACDTVVMNPPFGAQKAHADRPFIDRALELAGEVYGIFNAGSTPFVAAYTEGQATIEEVIRCEFPMRRTFAHHRKDRVDITVEVIHLSRI
ncbi:MULTISPECIES: METTL5 family protein [Methanoculleus]|jgi:putative methylase|uniref:Methyltransferase-like protein 5 n=1 Tax=Methanoculleus thermophilus TaxID=2200 RepID=A0A1G8XJ70_9EURY|nr:MULTISPECIES: METTL5 family protein [Methanoculleus]NLN08063.1 methyltransferase [Methanoculleus thermophilus]SDJ90254.1 methyltransferase [Methanoculleus thermophilus]HQD27032.1 METTL5 family protein [Methanoculleus thermophilus]